MNTISENTIEEKYSLEEKKILEQINQCTIKINEIIAYRKLPKLKQIISQDPMQAETIPTIEMKILLIKTNLRQLSNDILKQKVTHRMKRINNIISQIKKEAE